MADDFRVWWDNLPQFLRQVGISLFVLVPASPRLLLGPFSGLDLVEILNCIGDQKILSHLQYLLKNSTNLRLDLSLIVDGRWVWLGDLDEGLLGKIGEGLLELLELVEEGLWVFL